jgi:hypothetical protein
MYDYAIVVIFQLVVNKVIKLLKIRRSYLPGEMHLRILVMHQCCSDLSELKPAKVPSRRPKCVSPILAPELPPGETQTFDALPDLGGFILSAVLLFAGFTVCHVGARQKEGSKMGRSLFASPLPRLTRRNADF